MKGVEVKKYQFYNFSVNRCVTYLGVWNPFAPSHKIYSKNKKNLKTKIYVYYPLQPSLRYKLEQLFY